MRGAIPAGCRLRRSTLTGGRSSSASAPDISIGTARLYETSVQWRSTASAGYGSCPLSTDSTALRTASMAGIVEPSFAVHRRIAGGDQQSVAFAQRHVEPAREPKQHGPARHRPTALDEAQMSRRDGSLARKIELAEMTTQAPVAEQGADRKDAAGSLHDGTIAKRAAPFHDLQGNRRCERCRQRCHGRAAVLPMGQGRRARERSLSCPATSNPVSSCAAPCSRTRPAARRSAR